MANHLFDCFRAAAPAPDRPFLETETGTRLVYADMFDQSARFAGALVALGVMPGDRVAAQVEKTPAALFLYIACIRAGAVFLPMNTAYTDAEIAYFLGDAEPRLFVCDPSRIDSLRRVADAAGVTACETLDASGSGSLADRAASMPTLFEDVDRGPDDLAAILYTSGTTGRSKGAMLSHDNLASNGRILVETWKFTSDDVLIHALPVFHTHGLFVATNIVLLAGASMFFLPKFDPDEIMRLMPRATTMMGVPTFYVRLLQHPGLDRNSTGHMRLFVSGSAPLLAETHLEWREKTGHAILERYGMTETNMNTSNPYVGERRAGTVGFPLAETDVRVSDPETGAAVSAGAIGMIEIRGPNVFKGYWRMPEKTASEFREDGFFISGDLGRIDADGYVHIVGRGKDLVISGGYNVYPKEIETEIDAIHGVTESAVIGLPHPDFGEGVAAVIVRKDGSSVDEGEVMLALKDRLARYKQPKRIFFVDQLPRNAMGKVQKNVLRDRYQASFAKSR